MDKDAIEKLVDEELARRRVGSAFEPAQKKSIWAGFFRHPLFLTVFAFLVTTVIGGWYDHILKERDAEAQAIAQAASDARDEARAAVEGLREFATLVFERQTRSDLLRWAVVRGDGAAALKRKDIYDNFYVQWDVELALNLRRLRGYLGDHRRPSVYEIAVETSIAPSFVQTDACLTLAYDTARRLDFPYPSPIVPDDPEHKCAKREWFSLLTENRAVVHECMEEILDNMIPQIRLQADRSKTHEDDSDQMQDARRATEREIHMKLQEACVGMPEAPVSPT